MSLAQPEAPYSFEPAYRRERLARRRAEELLESRSRDLYVANQRIESQFAELRQAHEELKLAQAQLVQSEKMASVGQLAAGIAHEINNPIAFVKSNLNSLQRCAASIEAIVASYARVTHVTRERFGAEMGSEFAALDRELEALDSELLIADLRDIVAESVSGTDRVTEIVTGLRNFSRLDEDAFKSADLNEGIRATLRIARNEIKYRCVVTTDLHEIPRLDCYPGQLNQVFLNLLMNAVQACGDAGRIDIRTRADDRHIHVEFEDNGSGIAEENLSAIFTPFFTTKPVGEGTGLGLSISYAIVDKHGGDIRVASVEGKGTTFTVMLPIVRGTEAES